MHPGRTPERRFQIYINTPLNLGRPPAKPRLGSLPQPVHVIQLPRHSAEPNLVEGHWDRLREG